MNTTIPVEVEEITAAWLTTAVQQRAPGAEVVAVEILDAHSGTTGRARVGVTCDDERVPDTLFVKLPPFSDERRAFMTSQGMGVTEARFYAEIAADVPVPTPHVWCSMFDDAGGYIMVFDDLMANGGREPSAHDADIATTVDGVIDNFAALHATFMESERFDTSGDLAWVEQRSRTYGGAGSYVQMALDALGDDMPPASRELAALYLEHVDAIVQLLAAGPRTLVHGDAHLGNMFVDARGPGLLDWAVIGYGAGMRDVAYFIGNSVTTEFRREHERRLVERYCDGLESHGATVDRFGAWDSYRVHMVSPWIAAVVTAGFGSELQPIEIGMRAVKRSDVVIGDLGLIDLLREKLS